MMAVSLTCSPSRAVFRETVRLAAMKIGRSTALKLGAPRVCNADKLPSGGLGAHPGDWSAVLIDITQYLSPLIESSCVMLALCLSSTET